MLMMCGTGAELEVRSARAADEQARLEVLQDALNSHFRDAFLYFYFQELTLQGVVLAGAVLFIFCGASVGACCWLPAAAAVAVATGVAAAHAGVGAAQRRQLRAEHAGWVVERAGRLLATASLHRAAPGAARLRALAVHRDWRRRGAGAALARAVRAHAERAGFAELEARVSHVQGAARALLHKHGWELRASYVRPAATGLLELPMALLGLDLPAA